MHEKSAPTQDLIARCAEGTTPTTEASHRPEVILHAQGKTVMDETRREITPLSNFDPAICLASSQLLSTTAQEVENCCLIPLHQRIVLQLIPVSCIEAMYDRTKFTYWVYGIENEVSADEYPAKFAGCCTVQ